MQSPAKRIISFLTDNFPLLAALPALIWQTFFSIVPMVAMFAYSFVGTSETHNFLYFFTFDYYLKLLNIVYLKAIYNAILLGVATVFGSLIFCFSASYAITFFVRRKFQPFCIILMMLPLWTNFIVRIYSWFFLLDRRGILSYCLTSLGIIDSSTQFLFNPMATILGMIYCYYPFMLLPLYMSMSAIKNDQLEASADLGADALATLRYLIIPACLQDILFTSGLVGLMAFGEFAIPQLLGGSKYSFWGSVITSKFISQQDFKTGAAFTFLGLAAIGVVCGIVWVLWLVFKKIKNYNDQEIYVEDENNEVEQE